MCNVYPWHIDVVCVRSPHGAVVKLMKWIYVSHKRLRMRWKSFTRQFSSFRLFNSFRAGSPFAMRPHWNSWDFQQDTRSSRSSTAAQIFVENKINNSRGKLDDDDARKVSSLLFIPYHLPKMGWAAMFMRASAIFHAFNRIILFNDSLRRNNKKVLFVLCVGEPSRCWLGYLSTSFHPRRPSQRYNFSFSILLLRLRSFRVRVWSSWKSVSQIAILFIFDATAGALVSRIRGFHRQLSIARVCVFIALAAACTLHQPTAIRSNKLQLQATT